MTIPKERINAITNARELLLELIDPRKTPKVPLDVRRRARAVLKHFPHYYQIEELANGKVRDFKCDDK